jgi:hypothetical protein
VRACVVVVVSVRACVMCGVWCEPCRHRIGAHYLEGTELLAESNPTHDRCGVLRFNVGGSGADRVLCVVLCCVVLCCVVLCCVVLCCVVVL